MAVRLMLAAWTVDAITLLYIVGVWPARLPAGGVPPSLPLGTVALPIAMLGGNGPPWTRGVWRR